MKCHGADCKARDALVVSHLPLVDQIARSIASHLPPSFGAADLAGIGAIALIAAAERYAPESHNGAPFAVYARQIVRGAMLDSVRRRNWTANTCAPIEDAPEVSIAPATVAEIDQVRRWGHVTAAAQCLPSRQREIVEAHYGPEETPLADIAAAMGVSVGWVYMLHARAIATLRERLGRDEPPGCRLTGVPSNPKKQVIPIQASPSEIALEARQKAEIDELGALEKEFAPLRPKLARIELLRKSIRERYAASPAEKDFTAEGVRFMVAVGPRANESVINYPKLLKAIGAKLFCSIAKTTLKALEENVACGVRADVITIEAVGPRSLKTFERGAPELPKAA